MNTDEQNFQKRLVLWQLLVTIIIAIGAVMLASGQTLNLFGSELLMDTINETEEDTITSLQIMSKTFSKAGAVYTVTGTILILLSSILFYVIVKEKVRPKKTKYSKLKILADEMYDGKDLELKKKGYDAYSVKKLRLEGKPLRYDYSVLNYIKDNDMILITEDPENIGACLENNLPCIALGQNPDVNEIIEKLKAFKK